jgi:hypothetical protein
VSAWCPGSCSPRAETLRRKWTRTRASPD